MHPTTLMSCPRIHRRNRHRQTRTAIRDDQRQVLAFQPAAIQILEQAFPVGLTLSLTAQKRQQVTPADRKSTRLNSSHGYISYAVFCLKKKKKKRNHSKSDQKYKCVQTP